MGETMKAPALPFTLLPTLGLLFFSAGCDGTNATSKDTPVKPAATEATALAPSASASAATPAQKAGKLRPTAPSAKDRAAFLRDLNAGRKLAAAKDWPGAIKAFESALASSPDEPRALADLAWSAIQTNDLDRAEAANKRALTHAKEPKLRASVLYNIGRVAEARDNKEAAKKAYGESLTLRDNAEVKKRFEALGGAGAVPAAQPRSSAPCRELVRNIESLCACLQKTDLMIPEGVKFVCEPVSPAPALGHPDLFVLRYGAEMMGERVHFLAAREGGSVRALAEIGRDYEPGAFGVHNEAKVVGGEKRAVAGHTVVVVRSEQSNNDSNMAGLELCTYSAKLETVCALADGKATQCSLAIPVEVEDGCGPGVEPAESEMDDDTRKTIAEIKKNQTKSSAKTRWSLSDDGKLVVTLTEGKRDLIDPAVFQPRALW